jgi:hypothetical protein
MKYVNESISQKQKDLEDYELDLQKREQDINIRLSNDNNSWLRKSKE